MDSQPFESIYEARSKSDVCDGDGRYTRFTPSFARVVLCPNEIPLRKLKLKAIKLEIEISTNYSFEIQ